MKTIWQFTQIAIVSLLLASCSDNGSDASAQRSEDDLQNEMPVVLDLSSESIWDVTTFLFNDSVFQSNNGELLVIPEEANWIMTLSPRPGDFSGAMRIDFFCGSLGLEFTLIDQVMTPTSTTDGISDISCAMGLDIGDIPREVAIQRASTAMNTAFMRGEGVYGVIQENPDSFVLQIPTAGDITFKRSTNS